MNRHKTLQWLAMLGLVPEGRQHGSWITIRCPFAMWRHDGGEDRNPSFGVATTHGDSQVHCLACQYAGRLSSLALELVMTNRNYELGWELDAEAALSMLEASVEDDPVLEITSDDEEKVVDRVWPEDWLDSFVMASENEEAMAYLNARDGGRYPTKVLDHMGVRFDWNHKRVCFPVRGLDGKLRGLQGRSTDGSEPRYYLYSYGGYRTSDLWLGEEHLDFDRTVVLVEGPFDQARVLQAYRNSVAGLGANINVAKARRLNLATSLVTLFDVGKAGDTARNKITRLFPNTKVQHLKPPEGRKDPGESSAYEIAILLEEAGLEPDDIWI